MSRASWHDGRERVLAPMLSLPVACAHDEPTSPIPVGDEAAELDGRFDR